MPTPREALPVAVARELLDGAGDQLIALEANGTIVAANTAAAARLGRPRAFVTGKPLAALVALADRARWRAALRDARDAPTQITVGLEDGHEITATLRAVVADGTRYVTLALTPNGAAP